MLFVEKLEAKNEIKQSLVVRNCSTRWCPHNVMMADPLTKQLHEANLQPLLRVVQSGHCTLGSQQRFQQDREAGRIFAQADGQNSFRWTDVGLKSKLSRRVLGD